MKILYDYQCFTQKYGGVSRYFAEIMHNAPKDIKISKGFIFSENEYINEYNPRTIFCGKKHFIGKGKILYYLNRWISILYMLIGHYDLLHVTSDDSYFLKYNRKPFVITIHDMILEHLYGKESWVKPCWIESRNKIIHAAKGIIVVSLNTKKELLKYYPDLPEDKIHVIYHGSNHHSDFSITENPWGKYILFVGKRDSYKNYSCFVKAISSLLIRDTSLKLICTGLPFHKDEIELHKKLLIADKVIHIGADDKTLFNLYRNAQLFVFPSLMEGFGIPILEAWDNDCPIALSNASCFPEIAGKAAVYFNPSDESSILKAIDSVYNNPSLRDDLIRLGKEQITHYNWTQSAMQLAEIYQTLLSDNKKI